MKTLIIAVNSRYIHSSLAGRYLKASCDHKDGEVKLLEYTINDNADAVLSSIYMEKADVAAFSCYIWNIDYVLSIAESLKSVLPGIKIVLGGPEVSFDPEKIIKSNPAVDFIVSGEGEYAFPLLLKHINTGVPAIEGMKGLTYRIRDNVYTNGGYNIIDNLDALPSPYDEEMISAIGSNRIVYYESSRGCPFSCTYCISSTFEGVRYFSMERVKNDIEKLVNARVRQIKFVDRTFNCNRARAMEIFKYIIDSGWDINFHFEIGGDLFDEGILTLLKSAPKGLIQFEIGVQTVNDKAIESIKRKTDFSKLAGNIEKLRSYGNIHLHLDLIAGLPCEDLQSFGSSFDWVYSKKPHQLQLGFLKLLKGSGIRKNADEHMYKFKNHPPYEILSNKYMGFDDIIRLKGMEELVDRYYNSGKFVKTLDYVITGSFHSPFDFYNSFYLYGRRKGIFEKSVSSRELYGILIEFLTFTDRLSGLPALYELLKYDYLASDNSNNLPEGLIRDRNINLNELTFEFLKKEENIISYLPLFAGVPAKQIFKKIHIEVFNFDIMGEEFAKEKTAVIFNYTTKDKVTGLYECKKINGTAFFKGGHYE